MRDSEPTSLSAGEIESFLHGGLIGGTEPFLDWLNRANQVPMDDHPGKLAAYLHGIGVEALRWEQAGPWKRDNRVSITYLIATLVPEHKYVPCELDYVGQGYEWKNEYEFNHLTQKWLSELWIEYHSAPPEHRTTVLQVLENAMIGEISYPLYLSTGASTDVGVQSRVLTARGILDIRSELDPDPKPDQWSSYLVVNLPPGELARNANMPPIPMAEFVSMMLRMTAFFLIKTEVWMRFHETLPLHPWMLARIESARSKGKWWK